MSSEDRVTKLTDTHNIVTGPIADEAEQARAIAGANHDAELSGRKVRVTFFSTQDQGGQDAIFASLNFFAYQIPRDVQVDIPLELVKVFEDANTRMFITSDKGGTTERNVKRFNFSVHGEVETKAAATKAKKAA